MLEREDELAVACGFAQLAQAVGEVLSEFGRRGHHYTFLYLGQDILSPETVSGKVRKFRNSFSILPPDVTHRMLTRPGSRKITRRREGQRHHLPARPVCHHVPSNELRHSESLCLSPNPRRHHRLRSRQLSPSARL